MPPVAGLEHGHEKSQMRLLLFFAAVARLTTASYLRGAAPRSAGGPLFLNTTQAAPLTSTEAVSLISVELPSSADGNPMSSDHITSLVNSGLSSTSATIQTTPNDVSIAQGSLGSSSTRSVEPTHFGLPTITTGSPGFTSNSAEKPTNSVSVTTSQSMTYVESSIAESTARAEVTTSLRRPSSTPSDSQDSAGPASTHIPESSQPLSTPSVHFPANSLMPSSVYNTGPVTVSLSTTTNQETAGAPTLDSTPPRIVHSAATQNLMSSSLRTSGIVESSPSPLTGTTTSLPALTPKPQTAIHAVAIDSNATMQASQPPILSPTPTRIQGQENAAEDTTVAGTAASQTVRGSSTSRMSTASAITLTSGGANPTTILTEVASQTTLSGQIQASVTGLPSVILPGSSNSSSADSNLIQLGFLSQLNYVFVAQHLQAAAQIFQILPDALTQGTVTRSAVEITKLVPYDRLATTGYIATIAKLYYPKALVDQLQRDILNPNSDIYTRGGDVERNLTALIDPTIKITDDNGGIGCASATCDTNSAETASSSKGKGIAAGAVVGGAAFCGLVGLGLFQLYRRRGAARGVAWPFGKPRTGRLDGTRISRPINPVNSLGWNWLTPE